MTECCLLRNLQIPRFTKQISPTDHAENTFPLKSLFFSHHRSSNLQRCQISHKTRATTAHMEVEQSEGSSDLSQPMKLLFVEMGVGYDQHGFGHSCFTVFSILPLLFCCQVCFLSVLLKLFFYRQNITSAAMRACRDAIASNSIPAFRRGNYLVLGFSICIVC